jgi:uncharacterized protein
LTQTQNSGELRRSRYNFFARVNEGIVGYNARTGVFALLAEDIYSQLVGDSLIWEIRDKQDLVEAGFLYYGDEVEKIKARFSKTRVSSRKDKEFSLTIAPTLKCNRKCDYCYQEKGRTNRTMAPRVQKATLSFASRLLALGYRGLHCTWYGGEPLLAKETVCEMSTKLKRLVEKVSGRAEMSIITNGTLLSVDTAKALARSGVSRAQVTFDSLADNGINKRGVLNEEGEPSVILKNIIRAKGLIGFSIRINVTANNHNEIPQIIKILKRNKLDELCYFARVSDSNGGYSNSISLPKFAELERQVLFRYGKNLRLTLRKLTPRSQFCAATSGNLFVIDPEGYISRCWHDVDTPSEAIGHVTELKTDFSDSAINRIWMNYSPFENEECHSCKVLPLCLGGCARLVLLSDYKTRPCESIREQIQSSVERVAKHLEIRT